MTPQATIAAAVAVVTRAEELFAAGETARAGWDLWLASRLVEILGRWHQHPIAGPVRVPRIPRVLHDNPHFTDPARSISRRFGIAAPGPVDFPEGTLYSSALMVDGGAFSDPWNLNLGYTHWLDFKSSQTGWVASYVYHAPTGQWHLGAN